jgi:myosin heavy subunit
MALKRVELFENNVGVSDMVLLDPLTELAVIDNLKKRFYSDHIYVSIVFCVLTFLFQVLIIGKLLSVL